MDARCDRRGKCRGDGRVDPAADQQRLRIDCHDRSMRRTRPRRRSARARAAGAMAGGVARSSDRRCGGNSADVHPVRDIRVAARRRGGAGHRVRGGLHRARVGAPAICRDGNRFMIAIDPNLWLFSRLALGRGWKPIVLLVAGVAVGAALWLRVWSMPILLPVRTTADPGFLFLAYLLLCAGPILSVARLLDLENGGLLDLTRLSGQPIPRVLALVVVGTSWAYVVASAV